MENKKNQKLTILIPTFNNENIVEAAIRSVLWADEILVIDSFSTDKTIEIAKKYGARVIKRKFTYHAEQKNWAIPQAYHEWILVLDTDEIVTYELRNEIKKLLLDENINKYDGYEIARKHFFLGKFMRWGGRYPLYNVRLFKRSCRYEDRNVHEHIVLPKSKMKKIKGDILHYSDRSLVDFFEKFERYTTKQAEYLLKIQNDEKLKRINWKEFFVNGLYAKSIIKDVWFFIPMTSFGRFVYMYFIRLGFLDGKYGFLLAILYSFQDYTSKIKYLQLAKKEAKYQISFHNRFMNFCHHIAGIIL